MCFPKLISLPLYLSGSQDREQDPTYKGLGWGPYEAPGKETLSL